MLESASAALKKAQGDAEKEIKKLRLNRGHGGPSNGMNSASLDQVERLNDELAKLRAEFNKHRDYALKHIGDLDAEMPHKADKQDIIDLENRIMDKLREMMQQIINQFATKDDVNKRFA